MALIRVGDMLRIKGVHGFGFLKEIVYTAESRQCVFIVLVCQFGVLKADELVTLSPDDCEHFHAATTTAKSAFNSAGEHEMAFMEMAA